MSRRKKGPDADRLLARAHELMMGRSPSGMKRPPNKARRIVMQLDPATVYTLSRWRRKGETWATALKRLMREHELASEYLRDAERIVRKRRQ